MDEIDTRTRHQTLDRGVILGRALLRWARRRHGCEGADRPHPAQEGPLDKALIGVWVVGRHHAFVAHVDVDQLPVHRGGGSRPRSRSGSRSRRQVLVTRLCGGPAREHQGEAFPGAGRERRHHDGREGGGDVGHRGRGCRHGVVIEQSWGSHGGVMGAGPLLFSPLLGPQPAVGVPVSSPCWPDSSVTAWPPNWLRRAESILSWYESGSWEAKRVNNDVAITGAETPRSMASWAVQRPSPESATTPLMSSKPAPGRRARSANSRSQLRTIEP